jgi:hypothetical protein
MTQQQHPITPSIELITTIVSNSNFDPFKKVATAEVLEHIITKAAQWGADQELEACCEWLGGSGYAGTGTTLRAARRPKPQTLNSIALQMLGTIERDGHYIPEITDTIRRALEALPND